MMITRFSLRCGISEIDGNPRLRQYIEKETNKKKGKFHRFPEEIKKFLDGLDSKYHFAESNFLGTASAANRKRSV